VGRRSRRIGERRQTAPPRLDEDVAKLAAKGVTVFIVDDDLRERGIGHGDLGPGVKPIVRARFRASSSATTRCGAG